jgi:hypothetical protein
MRGWVVACAPAGVCGGDAYIKEQRATELAGFSGRLFGGGDSCCMYLVG